MEHWDTILDIHFPSAASPISRATTLQRWFRTLGEMAALNSDVQNSHLGPYFNYKFEFIQIKQ